MHGFYGDQRDADAERGHKPSPPAAPHTGLLAHTPSHGASNFRTYVFVFMRPRFVLSGGRWPSRRVVPSASASASAKFRTTQVEPSVPSTETDSRSIPTVRPGLC